MPAECAGGNETGRGANYGQFFGSLLIQRQANATCCCRRRRNGLRIKQSTAETKGGARQFLWLPMSLSSAAFGGQLFTVGCRSVLFVIVIVVIIVPSSSAFNRTLLVLICLHPAWLGAQICMFHSVVSGRRVCLSARLLAGRETCCCCCCFWCTKDRKNLQISAFILVQKSANP